MRLYWFALVALFTTLLSFLPIATFAQSSFETAIEGAVLRNDLTGPFGAKHNWDQYIDKATTELQLEYEGAAYGWEDLFKRASFFFHTDLDRELSQAGGDFSSLSTDNFTRFHVFRADNGDFIAGWRNFHDDRASVFTIRKVDSERAIQVGETAKEGQEYRVKRRHIEALLEDPAFEIVFQANSEKQRASRKSLGLEFQRSFTIKHSDINRLFYFFKPKKNEYFQKALFPKAMGRDQFLVDNKMLDHFRRSGCLPAGAGKVQFFEEKYVLSQASRCFLSHYSRNNLDNSIMSNQAFPVHVFKNLQDYAFETPIEESFAATDARFPLTNLVAVENGQDNGKQVGIEWAAEVDGPANPFLKPIGRLNEDLSRSHLKQVYDGDFMAIPSPPGGHRFRSAYLRSIVLDFFSSLGGAKGRVCHPYGHVDVEWTLQIDDVNRFGTTLRSRSQEITSRLAPPVVQLFKLDTPRINTVAVTSGTSALLWTYNCDSPEYQRLYSQILALNAFVLSGQASKPVERALSVHVSEKDVIARANKCIDHYYSSGDYTDHCICDAYVARSFHENRSAYTKWHPPIKNETAIRFYEALNQECPKTLFPDIRPEIVDFISKIRPRL